MDKEYDLKAWRQVQCDSVPSFYNGDVPMCVVLGELFGKNCRNDVGERCRYF